MDHNAVTPVRLEPVAPLSRVKHSTPEPLPSQGPSYEIVEIYKYEHLVATDLYRIKSIFWV